MIDRFGCGDHLREPTLAGSEAFDPFLDEPIQLGGSLVTWIAMTHELADEEWKAAGEPEDLARVRDRQVIW
jgi:hypothetical protein